MTTIVAHPTGLDTIVSPTSFPSANNVDITGISDKYRGLQVVVSGASHDTGSQVLMLRVSTDNGSTFAATNYLGYINNVAGTVSAYSIAWTFGANVQATTDTVSGTATLFGYQDASAVSAILTGAQSITNGSYQGNGCYLSGSGNIDALRLIWTGAPLFDAGTYALYGIL